MRVPLPVCLFVCVSVCLCVCVSVLSVLPTSPSSTPIACPSSCENSRKQGAERDASASGKLIEVQGTAEGEPFPRESCHKLIDLGLEGVLRLTELQQAAVAEGAPA